MSYTKTTLKQAIQDYAENDETTFVNNLDNFIKNAEEKLLKVVDLDVFRKNVNAAMTTGNRFLSQPTDYLATFSLSYNNGSGTSHVFLEQKDVNFLQTYWTTPTTTGAPRYYSVFDVGNFLIAPTPNQDYAVELHYYYRPASITGATGTSWLGENAPDALLYGSLVEAYIFMKGDPNLLQMYRQQFEEAALRLKNYGEGVENTEAYRDGLVRTQKT
jgi:hypothetical protein